jgi:hypothetical protein
VVFTAEAGESGPDSFTYQVAGEIGTVNLFITLGSCFQDPTFCDDGR